MNFFKKENTLRKFYDSLGLQFENMIMQSRMLWSVKHLEFYLSLV